MWTLSAIVFSGGCASAPLTTRIVESPSSEVVSYGAPRDIKYTAEVDPSLENARIIVYRRARCDVIPVKLVNRTEEKLRGDEVVERTVLTKGQHAQPAKGTVACDQTYASNVDVMLEVNGGRYKVGKTDPQGAVSADLAKLLSTSEMGQVPEQGTVLIRPLQAQPTQEAGTILFAELKKQQARMDQLLAELRAILDTERLSQQDSARAYELYNVLFELSPDDPRVEAASARLWELIFKRRREEATEDLSRNLQALESAQAIVKTMGDAALPLYVQVAVNSGGLDRKALEWSSLRLLAALRGNTSICSGGFSYSRLPSYGLGPSDELAAHYLHYAYGGKRDTWWGAACTTF